MPELGTRGRRGTVLRQWGCKGRMTSTCRSIEIWVTRFVSVEMGSEVKLKAC